MAVFGFLLFVALKALLANGFGFQVAPFQMELQLPAGGGGPFQGSPFGGPSPLMSMMSFPPIFNPMEAMGRGEMDADARMDVNGGPMGNVTTKNKTESKDGFKVTTITSDGPGFHSYIKEYEKEGNSSSGNSTGGGAAPSGPPPDIGKLLSSGKIFDIMNQLRNMGKKPPKCKKCGSGKFCDPIFHLCRKKFAEGRTCMAQKQCGANLRCQWGKCQKAKKGDPGTFCKGNNQCTGDSCCRNTPGSFHLMCIPPQTEGAICGLHERQESVAKLFYVVKRSTVPTCSPCKSGLKCANTGGGTRFKRCAQDSYVEKAAEEMEDDNPSNAITEDEDKEDGGSGKDKDKDEDKDEDKDDEKDDSGPPHPLKDPNVPDREDEQVEKEEGDDNEDEKEEKEDKKDDKEDKKEDKDDKEDKEDKDEKDDKEEDKEDKEEEDNKEDEKEKPKDEDKEDDKEDNEDEEKEDKEKEPKKEKGKDVSKEDKDDDKDDRKKPIQNGDGMEILVPKKKKKKGKAGKGKGKGKKE